MAAAWNDVPATGGLSECAALVRSAEALRTSAPELSVQLARRALLVGATDISATNAHAGEARTLSMRAQAVLAAGLVRTSQHVSAVEPGFAALTLAESGGALVLAADLRLDLAACAQEVGEPLLGGTLLRPVLEAAGAPPAVRAAALGRLVGCIAHVARRDDVEDALEEADRLLAADDGLAPDVRRMERARLAVRSAAYHRWYGDNEDAVSAARDGLTLLSRLRPERRPDSDRLHARLVLEMVCALLDEGELHEAETTAQPTVDEPVRATSAEFVGRLMLAMAARVHLPAGEVERGRGLVEQAAWLAERHGLDSVLADALTEVSRLEEQAGRAKEALEAMRTARAAEQRRMRAVAGAGRHLLLQVTAAQGARDTTQQAVSGLLRQLAHPGGVPMVVAPAPTRTALPPMASPEPPITGELVGAVDERTGLLNREGLVSRLRSARHGERPVALTLVRFEPTNDNGGYRGPDTGIMVGLADKVRDMAPDNAELARSDGGELAVLLPHATRDEAEEFVATIRETAAKSGWATDGSGKDMSISTSVVQSDPQALNADPDLDAANMLTAARDALTPAQAAAKREAAYREAAHRVAANREAAHRDAANRDMASRDAASRDVAGQDMADRGAADRDAASGVAARLDVANWGAASREVANRDVANRDAAHREAANRDAAHQVAASGDAADRDVANWGPANWSAASQDAASREVAGRDMASRNAAHGDAAHGDAAHREAASRDEANWEAASREVAGRDAVTTEAAAGSAAVRGAANHAGASQSVASHAAASPAAHHTSADNVAVVNAETADALLAGTKATLAALSGQAAAAQPAESAAASVVAPPPADETNNGRTQASTSAVADEPPTKPLNMAQQDGDPASPTGRSVLNSLSIPSGSGGRRRAGAGETAPGAKTARPTESAAAPRMTRAERRASEQAKADSAPASDDSGQATVNGGRASASVDSPVATGWPVEPDISQSLRLPRRAKDDAAAADMPAARSSNYEETRAELARMMTALNAKALRNRKSDDKRADKPAADAPKPLTPRQSIPTPPEPDEMPEPPGRPDIPEPPQGPDIPTPPVPETLPPSRPVPAPSPDPDPSPDPVPSPEPGPGQNPEGGVRAEEPRSRLLAAFDALTGPMISSADDGPAPDAPSFRTEFENATGLPSRKPSKSWSQLQTGATVDSPAAGLFGTSPSEGTKTGSRVSLGAAFNLSAPAESPAAPATPSGPSTSAELRAALWERLTTPAQAEPAPADPLPAEPASAAPEPARPQPPAPATQAPAEPKPVESAAGAASGSEASATVGEWSAVRTGEPIQAVVDEPPGDGRGPSGASAEPTYDAPIGPQPMPRGLPRRGERSATTIASLLTEALAAYQSTNDDQQEPASTPPRVDSLVGDSAAQAGRHRSPE